MQTLVLRLANGSMMVQYERGFTWVGLVLGFLACGSALAAISTWLARWLVSPLRNECPQRGYALESLTSARCPECGLHIFGRPNADEQSPMST